MVLWVKEAERHEALLDRAVNYFPSRRVQTDIQLRRLLRLLADLRVAPQRPVRLNKHALVRRHLPNWKISDDGVEMFRPTAIAIERYRYRGAKIPAPWPSETTGSPAPAA